MQSYNPIQALLGQTDIYLIDQLMKGRYNAADTLLDAGCGSGRNMHWFLNNGFSINGIDINTDNIQQLKHQYPHLPEGKLLVSAIEHMPFAHNHFNHIICSAVLHFAKSTAHFNLMFTALLSVLKPGGTVFIRMTSNIGMEEQVALLADGVYSIPDGSTRFLLTRHLLAACVRQHNLSLIEPLKTVNVDDVRCMSTLIIQKN